MRVLFQNHASLLIEHDGEYLLTDPWFNQPAFGSWLPTFPPYVHPVYLAALGQRLTILISHGHDDHFDDRLLTLFDKDTRIVTADFRSPSVINRLKRLGFERVQTVGNEGAEVDSFTIHSFIVEAISHDDASYLITTDKGAVIHANDNWHSWTNSNQQRFIELTAGYARSDILLFSQTNSASGFPLNYDNYTEAEQDRILRKKVARMVEGGLRNAEALNLPRLFSYAGFATPYVSGQRYHERGLFPTAAFLRQLLDEQSIHSNVAIADFYPGDVIWLPGGRIERAFIRQYSDAQVKAKAHQFYELYGHINECISYTSASNTTTIHPDWLDDFLNAFNEFATRTAQNPDGHFASLFGKTFQLTVTHHGQSIYQRTLCFGEGIIDDIEQATKTCTVDATIMQQVLQGDALFEDLYTGYNARWSRYPEEQYNRDIVMIIVMFSYVYKNRLAKRLITRNTN